MASHTRVLLKARSFAGATLRESITHKHKNGRDYARTSLRENQLRHYQDQHTAMSEVEYQQNSFPATSEAPSETASFISSQCDKYETTEVAENEATNVDFHNLETTSVEETSVVIINTLTRQERLYHARSLEQNSEEVTSTNEELRDAFCSQWTEPVRRPFDKNLSVSSSSAAAENELPFTYKTSVIITDSASERDSLDSARAQMVRARSFTGLMTPRADKSPSPSPTRERLDGAAGPPFLKIPLSESRERLLHVTAATRRARLSREGKSLRFSSDLGFGARPKSKREVFV